MRRRSHYGLGSLESLETRSLPSAISIATDQVVRQLNSNVMGVNINGYDGLLAAQEGSQTDTQVDPSSLNLIQNSGMNLFRISEGEGTDEGWHFDEQNSQFSSGVGLLANVVAAAGGDAMFCVNYGTGTPQEAAAYLAYLNGDVNNHFQIGTDVNGKDWQTVSFWASLRGQQPLNNDDGLNHLRTGHAAPYNFTYLEVGNEAYFNAWKDFSPLTQQDVKAYADFASELGQLSSHIDPSIKIGVGVGDPDEYKDLWNGPMLDACQADGFTPGFLSDHFYIEDGVPAGDVLTDSQLLNHTVSDPTSVKPDFHGNSPRNFAGRAAEYRQLLNDHLGTAAQNVELMVGEFNSDANASTRQTTALTNGLLLADAIGSIMQTEYNGLLVWNLRGGYQAVPARSGISGWRTGAEDGMIGDDDWANTGIGAPANGPDVAFPTYYAEQLTSMLGGTGDSVIQTQSDTGTVDAYSTLRADGHMEILLINKSPTATDSAALNINGFVPSSDANLWLYGLAEDNAQRLSSDGASALTHLHPSLAVTSAGGSAAFGVALPAYSMTLLDLVPSTGEPNHPAPEISAVNSALNYSQGTSKLQLSSAASITDPDNAAAGSKLTFQVQSASSKDLLAIQTGSGVSVSRNSIGINKQQIATLSGGKGTPLVITFNSSATSTAIETVLRRIVYTNKSLKAGAPDRSIQIQFINGSLSSATPVNIDLHVTAKKSRRS
jgi:hypothetical protein